MCNFICAVCGIIGVGINDEEWNPEKKLEEFLILTPEFKDDPVVQICDDCFQGYKAWLDKLTPEDIKRIREEFYND